MSHPAKTTLTGSETAPAAASRRIRVFISSTFRDMIEERDNLMTHTWPALRRLCEERHVELVEVDLRWGIAESQITRKETLKLCLDEIRSCRPYFIGLLGERYGWAPGDDAFTADLKEEQPWLLDLHGKSVTELEILHGVLNNPDMAIRAFFYFRDPAYAQGRGPDFFPETDADANKQAALKTLIRTVCAAKQIPLRENYPDPKQLAALVLADLSAAVEAQFSKENIPDPLTREAEDHEAFAEIRRRTYIGRDDYFEALDRHAAGEGGPLLLLGDSGSGKSALLANWLARWRKDHPKDFIFQHFIGGTADSADHWRLMIRLMAEIKRWSGDPEALPAKHDHIFKDFPLWLTKARARALREGVRFILVLDALNQLDGRHHARLLGWLPEHPFCGPLRLIVSTLPGQWGTDDPLGAIQKRRWQELRVQPLTVDERRRMIADYLARFGKKLDEHRLVWLASAVPAANPLYLKILLDDLRVTGTYDRLDDRLKEYLAAADIAALLQQVLARYRRDYERDRQGLVGEALGLIYGARRGLSETELLQLLRPDDQARLPPAIWTPLRAALEDSLVDRGGILNFSHNFLATAVGNAFAADKERCAFLRQKLADFFEALPITARTCDELPWLLKETDSPARLRTCLLDINRFLLIYERDREELRRYWIEPLHEQQTMGKAYLASYKIWSRDPGRQESRMALAANELAMFLLDAASYAEAEPLYNRALAIWEKALGPDHPDVAVSLNNLALLYKTQGQYSRAEPLYKRALAINEKALGPNRPYIARSLNNLAELYCSQGRYAQAEPLFKRALAVWEKALGPDHPDVALSLNNLAGLYYTQGQNAQAEPLYNRALAIWEKALGPDHPLVALSLNNLAALYKSQGQYAQAERLHKSALAIWEKSLGPDHPDAAASLNNLAALYDCQGRYAQAEPLYKSALAIFEKALGPDHPDVATSLINLAGLFYAQGQCAQAEPLYKRSLAIREKALGPDHPDVATSLINLAWLYYTQGQYTQAEPLYKRSLAIREKALGPNHPDVAMSLNTLAALYSTQGRCAQAEPLYMRALAIWEKALGPDHRDVAMILKNMARLYRKTGREKEAGELEKRAAAIRAIKQ